MVHRTTPRCTVALAVSVGLCGCGKLPDAPEELEELSVYLFEHMLDEDDAHLRSGLINLRTWLDGNFEEANEGYRVDDLPASAVEDLEQAEPDLEKQIGAAVAYDIPHGLEDVVWVGLEADPLEVSPDQYESFTREWLTDPDCFFAQECMFAEVITESIAHYPLGIEITITNMNQYRWVETEQGMANVRRNWMTVPGEVNVDWISLEQQYYVGALLTVGDEATETRRMDCGWVIAELVGAPVPEDMGVKLAVQSMKEYGEAVTSYLDGQGER